jgi:hypothetical protein
MIVYADGSDLKINYSSLHINISKFFYNKIIEFGTLLTNHLLTKFYLWKKYFYAAVLLLSLKGFSQGSTDYGAGLKFNLNEDGSKFMRVIAWNQIWFRSAQMNPGTMIEERHQLQPTLVIDVCVF